MKNLKALMLGFAGLFLAVLLGFGTVRAEAHEDHCVCGGTGDCIATAKEYGHEGVASQGRTEVAWTAVGSSSEFFNVIAEAKNAGKTNVYLYLSASFQLSKGIADSSAHGMHVFLCLNGQTLQTASSRLFTAYLSGGQSEMKLSICDCSNPSTGNIQSRATASTVTSQGGMITLDANGRFYLYGGTLNGGTCGTYAGNISVGSGKMYMYGGTVSGGTATTFAGNINVGAGQLYIYDGTVSGGSAGSYGGNIALGAGELRIYKGTISGGEAATNGGNINIGSGTAYFYNGTVTEGNAKYGGNIVVSSGKCYMSNGTVSAGTATASAGNVRVESGTFEMAKGTITDGTAATYGGNVFVGTGTFTMNGGLLADGTARTSGAGGGGIFYVDKADGEVHVSGGKITGGVNDTVDNTANGHVAYLNGKMYISGDAVVEAVNKQSYAITTQAGSSELHISGNPVLYKKSGANVNLLQCTATGSVMDISGGTFIGFISGHKGNVYVSGGYFDRAIGHAKDSGAGVLEITGGYFAGKSTSAALSIPDTVWKVGEDAWIPFNYTATYAKADGTTASFTTKYAVTSHRQVNGRSMALNENLAIQLYADVDVQEPLYSSSKVTVALNGESREYTLSAAEALSEKDPRKVLSFTGVTPELMGDEITVKLYASDGTTVLDEKTYTIKEYLTELQNKTAAELGISDAKKSALDTLVTDLLVYGREAQKKFNHNTDALVIAERETGSGRTPDGNIADIWNKTEVTRDNYQDAEAVPGYFKEATVIHENVNWIRVKFNDNAADGQTTFTVQKADGAETPVTLTEGYLVTDGLMPTEYGTRFIYRAYRGTEVISKVEYSMNSYCVRKHTYEGHAFSDALFNYGASALAYASAS